MAPVQNLQTSLSSPPVVVSPSPKKRPPAKKKKQKLDLANIMKLSGIGDDDDVMFESDASQSESDASTSTATTPQPEKKLPAPPQMVISQPQQIPQSHHQPGHAAPIVQVLNQTFQAQNAQQTPFGGFSIAAPNFTLGTNGLMAVQQRANGGFKLALGEDGRLVLQHDPTLNQDLQSQLLLQSIFGLNGGCGSLVLQPSIDQQIHSQTVQTIQQQSVQTIQQQTVQSQTIQTVQHQIVQPQIQSIQSQLQGQIQSLLQQQNIMQQPNLTLQGLAQQQQQQHLLQQQSQQAQLQKLVSAAPAVVANNLSSTAPTTTTSNFTPSASPVGNASSANCQTQFFPSSLPSTLPTAPPTSATGQQPVLKVQPFQKSQPPVQTVHPIHHQAHQHHHQQTPTQPQPPPQPQPPAPTSYVVNLTPEQLEQLKRNGQLTVNGQTIFMQRPAKDISEKKTSPKIKPIKKPVSKIAAVVKEMCNHNPAVVTAPPNVVMKSGNNLDKIINSVAGAGTETNNVPVNAKIKTAAIIQPSIVMQAQPQQQLSTQTKLVTAVAPANAVSRVMISPRCIPATTTTHNINNLGSMASTPSGMVVTPITPITPATSIQHIVVSSGMSLISAVPSVSVTMTTMAPSVVTSRMSVTPAASMPGLTMVHSTPASTAQVVNKQQQPEVVVKMDQQQNPDVERFLGQLMEETQLQQAKPVVKLQKQVQPVQMQMQMQLIQEEQPQVQQQQPPATTKKLQITSNQLIQPSQAVQAAQAAQATQPTPTPAPANIQTSQSMIVSSSLPLPQIPPSNQGQRIMIQLTPQKQQHLKSIQLQIQTLSTRMQPGNVETQNALKLLFQEQQNILASGKLLPPDKVFYHGNQIIVNNSSMVKNEVLSPPIKNQTQAQAQNATSSAPEIKPPVSCVSIGLIEQFIDGFICCRF